MANIKLIISIINYLKEVCKREKCLDTRESLEVAVQCLQTAYDIDSKDPSLTEKDNEISLEDIFNSAIISSEEDDEKSTGKLKKAEMMKNLGNNLMRNNQFSEAIRYYTAAIELDTTDAVYYGNRAAAYSKMNDFKNAIKDCEKAIEIDPKYAKAYGRMGLAYSSLEQYDKAVEAFSKAVELEPDNESYQSNLKLAAEKKSTVENKPPPSSHGGLGGLNIDWADMFNDPVFRNMASSLMQEQNILNGLSAGLTNALFNPSASSTAEGGASSSNQPNSNINLDMLFEAGQLLANQMQTSNPDLLEQIRNAATRHSNPDNKDSQ